MKLKFKLFYLEIDPFILVIVPVVYFAGYVMEYAVIYLSIILHELSHLAAAFMTGCGVYSVRLLPVGLNAEIKDATADKRYRVLIYLCGPLSNVFLAACGWLLSSYYLYGSDNMRFFIFTNLSLSIFNLLPVMPLDGGRILGEILAHRMGFNLAGKYMRQLTIVLSVALMLLGVVQTAGNPYNFSLLLIGCYILFAVKNQEMEAAFMNVKDVIYRRSRLLKKGIYPARELAVLKNIRLGDVLRNMDFDRFHIIYVLDEDLKILKVMTEQEIIEGLLKNHVDLTLEEYIFNEKNV